MKTWFAVEGVVLADAMGNMALRRGMDQIGDVSSCRPREIPALIYRMIRNQMLQWGVGCIAMAFFFFLALLSWADLSFALPATALSSVVNALGARFLLKEEVTAGRWVGILFICGGAALLQ